MKMKYLMLLQLRQIIQVILLKIWKNKRIIIYLYIYFQDTALLTIYSMETLLKIILLTQIFWIILL